jgi:hypothetical protein
MSKNHRVPEPKAARPLPKQAGQGGRLHRLKIKNAKDRDAKQYGLKRPEKS